MSIAILGAGAQAQAVAYYLGQFIHEHFYEIDLYDRESYMMDACESFAPKRCKNKHIVDLENIPADELAKMFKERKYAGIVNALPYRLIPKATEAAVKAGVKVILDLGGNDEVVAQQRSLHELAVKNGTIIIFGGGVAPGGITDLAYAPYKILADIYMAAMYCGVLKRIPKGELLHGLFFHEQGLYNEYKEMPQIIKHGKRSLAKMLEEVPDLVLSPAYGFKPFPSRMTHGAFQNDPKLWKPARYVYYATARWPGHYERMIPMLENLPREECIKQMKEKLGPAGDDMIVLQTKTYGKLNGIDAVVTYESVGYHDLEQGLTAMQRYTGFMAAEEFRQALTDHDEWPKGAVYHEQHMDVKEMIAQLHYFGIHIRQSIEIKG